MKFAVALLCVSLAAVKDAVKGKTPPTQHVRELLKMCRMQTEMRRVCATHCTQ